MYLIACMQVTCNLQELDEGLNKTTDARMEESILSKYTRRQLKREKEKNQFAGLKQGCPRVHLNGGSDVENPRKISLG